MTKLDWNKANRAEMPKLARNKSETRKRQEAVAKAYSNGTSRERERIVRLLELAKLKTGWDLEAEIDRLIQELKGQTK